MTTHRFASLAAKAGLALPISAIAIGAAMINPFAGAGATPAAVYRIETTIPLNVRATPSTAAAIVGHLAPGTTIAVVCQATGPVVNGSRIWDKTANGYVSDYWVSTPLFNAYSPGLIPCPGGTTPAPEPNPAPKPAEGESKAAQAVAIATSRVGSTAWDRPSQLCDAFVAAAYGYRGSGENTAYSHYNDLRAQGLIHTTPVPPIGALVFFAPTSANGWAGHVMLSRGDGSAVSNAVGGRIGITTIAAMIRASGPYLGWATGATGFPRAW